MRYITPEHCIRRRLGGRPAPSWPAALLVFRDYTHSQQVLEAFDNVRPIPYRLLYYLTGQEFEPIAFEADIAGRTIVVVTRCIWGGPQTAILVEELACLGVRFILGYGVGGSIDPSLPQGTFVVADSALPVDGTSRAYGINTVRKADLDIVQAAIAAAADAGVQMRPASAVTVDALYHETQELVDDLRRQGGQIINMETSTLYSVAGVCGVRSLWLGYVTDCLTNGQWQDWFVDLRDLAEKAIRVCRALLTLVLSADARPRPPA
jgi:uridine phosphorylase